MQDMMVHSSVTSFKLKEFKLIHAEFNGNYEQLLIDILQKSVFHEHNSKFAKGWSIGNIQPDFAMIGGILRNTTISPLVQDGFIYSGFSMQNDHFV